MVLNERQVSIIHQLYNLHVDLARGNDDQRRQLTRMIAEQICFEFGSDWGTKSSSPTNPQSKDSISFRLNSQTFDNWDWQNGTTRKPQVHVGQSGTTLTGQHFIVVTPTNHLGTSNGGTEPPDNIEEKLNLIIAQNSELKNTLSTMQQVLAHVNINTNEIKSLSQQILDKPTGGGGPFPITYPTYRGRVLGFNIALAPDPPMNP